MGGNKKRSKRGGNGTAAAKAPTAAAAAPSNGNHAPPPQNTQAQPPQPDKEKVESANTLKPIPFEGSSTPSREDSEHRSPTVRAQVEDCPQGHGLVERDQTPQPTGSSYSPDSGSPINSALHKSDHPHLPSSVHAHVEHLPEGHGLVQRPQTPLHDSDADGAADKPLRSALHQSDLPHLPSSVHAHVEDLPEGHGRVERPQTPLGGSGEGEDNDEPLRSALHQSDIPHLPASVHAHVDHLPDGHGLVPRPQTPVTKSEGRSFSPSGKPPSALHQADMPHLPSSVHALVEDRPDGHGLVPRMQTPLAAGPFSPGSASPVPVGGDPLSFSSPQPQQRERTDTVLAEQPKISAKPVQVVPKPTATRPRPPTARTPQQPTPLVTGAVGVSGLLAAYFLSRSAFYQREAHKAASSSARPLQGDQGAGRSKL